MTGLPFSEANLLHLASCLAIQNNAKKKPLESINNKSSTISNKKPVTFTSVFVVVWENVHVNQQYIYVFILQQFLSL